MAKATKTDGKPIVVKEKKPKNQVLKQDLEEFLLKEGRKIMVKKEKMSLTTSDLAVLAKLVSEKFGG